MIINTCTKIQLLTSTFLYEGLDNRLNLMSSSLVLENKYKFNKIMWRKPIISLRKIKGKEKDE